MVAKKDLLEIQLNLLEKQTTQTIEQLERRVKYLELMVELLREKFGFNRPRVE